MPTIAIIEMLLMSTSCVILIQLYELSLHIHRHLKDMVYNVFFLQKNSKGFYYGFVVAKHETTTAIQ